MNVNAPYHMGAHDVTALAEAGREANVKLKIAEAIQGKRIMLLPVSEGGMNLKTTDMNWLIETLGIRSLFGWQ